MTAIEFLRWAMDRHQAMRRFRATMEVSGLASCQRRILYERPNRYRITTEMTGGHSLTSVCDGARVVEYSVPPVNDAQSFPAPESISNASSMFMMHPMFCGSLMNRFFAGGSHLDLVADVSKTSIEYGGEESAGDELGREVVFYGAGMYGNALALIGTQSGKVYRLAYDSEPIMKMAQAPESRARMARALRERIAKEQDPDIRAAMEGELVRYDRDRDERLQEAIWTYCTFQDIEVDGDIPDSTFDTAPPDGAEVVPHDHGPRLPVPIGQPAPDATICDLQGNECKLSDFRGKVLLIDLWATWCGPCRKGLPDTASLAKAGRSEGFEVIAVSNEDPETVQAFLDEEGLPDLPTFIDPGAKLSQIYNASSIPTVIVIDAKGNLAEYLVGLRPVDQLRDAIEQARRV